MIPVAEVGFLEVIRVEKNAIVLYNSGGEEIKIPRDMMGGLKLSQGDCFSGMITYDSEAKVVHSVKIEEVFKLKKEKELSKPMKGKKKFALFQKKKEL